MQALLWRQHPAGRSDRNGQNLRRAAGRRTARRQPGDHRRQGRPDRPGFPRGDPAPGRRLTPLGRWPAAARPAPGAARSGSAVPGRDQPHPAPARQPAPGADEPQEPLCPADAGLDLPGAGPFYLIEAPMTTEIVACPAAHLRIVAAGNFGRVYQVYDLDPAVRRRFDTMIEFDYLPYEQELSLLRREDRPGGQAG